MKPSRWCEMGQHATCTEYGFGRGVPCGCTICRHEEATT